MSLTIVSGPWSDDQAREWLSDAVIPIRLASLGTRGPLVQSLWFTFSDDVLWCATQVDSVLARRLHGDSRVGWEISPDAPPYRGARGTGRAAVLDDRELAADTLSQLINRYGQSGTQLATWLMSRVATEVAIRIDDLALTSWDYSPRM